MKINGISLVVSLNFIVIAFTVPTTLTSQVKNYAVDYKSNPLEARDLLKSATNGVGSILNEVVNPTKGSTYSMTSPPEGHPYRSQEGSPPGDFSHIDRAISPKNPRELPQPFDPKDVEYEEKK